jgi:hypothetical protein
MAMQQSIQTPDPDVLTPRNHQMGNAYTPNHVQAILSWKMQCNLQLHDKMAR